MKARPKSKLHAIPRFPAGSFAVHIGDHLRFGIICGPIRLSFPVWGSFAVGDHLRCRAAPAYPYFTVSRHVANLQLDTSNLQLDTSILQLDT